MNELQIFNNPEFGEVRTVKLNGEPWLVGRDVAAALGYSNTKDALATHVDEEDKKILQRSDIATIRTYARFWVWIPLSLKRWRTVSRKMRGVVI